MNEITKPAEFAGAVQHAVPLPATGYVGCGEIMAQPPFEPVSRREIMAAVNTCRRELGLAPGVLVTLDALLSCLPCAPGQNGVVTHKMLLTIYASNDTLCFRAKGIADRQLRRHIDVLEKSGLLLRRDSANGKRFPLMRGGQVIGAFGLDLTPLFLRASEIIASANLRREQDQELRGMRARLRQLCSHLAQLNASEALVETLHQIGKLARRVSLTLTEAAVAIRQLTEIIAASPAQHAEEHENPSASAGHSGRLINPESHTKKRNQASAEAASMEWSEFKEVSAFFPPPSSKKEAQNIIYDFGRMLGIQQTALAQAASKVPVLAMLHVLDMMAGKISEITSPAAYLLTAINSVGQSKATSSRLLT